MTALEKLNKLPEHMRTKEWILSEIAHEEHVGIHTYHTCPCNRGYMNCRSVMCVQCWKDVLHELIEEKNCTCSIACSIACKGECGCEFCLQTYNDFLVNGVDYG